jgi:hypothetical protein
MSQSKVDQRKYEKKHRKEILRKNKIKKGLSIFAVVFVIVAIVGSVAGVKIYKAIPKYVKAAEINDYIDKAWADLGYDTLFTATDTDAEEDTDEEEADVEDTDAEDADVDTDAEDSDDTADTESEDSADSDADAE